MKMNPASQLDRLACRNMDGLSVRAYPDADRRWIVDRLAIDGAAKRLQRALVSDDLGIGRIPDIFPAANAFRESIDQVPIVVVLEFVAVAPYIE